MHRSLVWHYFWVSVGTFLEEISKRAGEFIEKIFSNMGINFLFLLELRCSSPIPGYPGAPGSLASGFGPNNTTSFPRLTGCGDSQPTQSHEPILHNKPLFSFLLLLSLLYPIGSISLQSSGHSNPLLPTPVTLGWRWHCYMDVPCVSWQLDLPLLHLGWTASSGFCWAAHGWGADAQASLKTETPGDSKTFTSHSSGIQGRNRGQWTHHDPGHRWPGNSN